MSADNPVVDGPYKWSQDTPAAQMVCLHMFLEGNYSNLNDGIINQSEFLEKLNDYMKQATALIKHLAKNPGQWETLSSVEQELEKMILFAHPTRPGPETAIGYWTEQTQNPRYYVFSWLANSEIKQTVIGYLKGHDPYSKIVKTKHRFRGFARCYFCKKPIGSTCLSDKTYIWPEGFGHYIEQHQVRPPEVLIKHILQYTSSL